MERISLKNEKVQKNEPKIDVHLRDEEGRVPFMKMILHRGSPKEVSRLMMGHPVNSRDAYGNTPLMMAMSAGHPGIATMLIQKGADLNLTNQYGFTALHYAKITKSEYLIDFLLGQGAKDVESIPINILNNVSLEGKVHTPIDILKRRTFVKNPILCNKIMVDLYGHMESQGDYRAAHIFKFVALKALEEESGKRTRLEIYGTQEPTTLSFDGDVAKGSFNQLINKIFIADIRQRKKASITLLHEMIHLVRHSKIDKDYDQLHEAQKKIYESLENEGSSKWADYLRKEILQRAETGYMRKQDILEENIADMSSVFLMGKEQSPLRQTKSKEEFQKERDLKELTKPLTDYFDKNMIPYMRAFIKNHPHRNLVRVHSHGNELEGNFWGENVFHQNIEVKISHHSQKNQNRIKKESAKAFTIKKMALGFSENQQNIQSKISGHGRVYSTPKQKAFRGIRCQIF
jgi:hypothetical protein